VIFDVDGIILASNVIHKHCNILHLNSSHNENSGKCVHAISAIIGNNKMRHIEMAACNFD